MVGLNQSYTRRSNQSFRQRISHVIYLHNDVMLLLGAKRRTLWVVGRNATLHSKTAVVAGKIIYIELLVHEYLNVYLWKIIRFKFLR